MSGAGCRGIHNVVLAALDVWLDVPGEHHAHVIAEPAELARPMMGCAARLKPDKPRRDASEESK